MPNPKRGKDKEHRYYLLPGMGASNRRMHQKIRFWTWIIAALLSALVGAALYFLNRR